MLLPQGSFSLEKHEITTFRHWLLLVLQQPPKLSLQVKVKLNQTDIKFLHWKSWGKKILFNIVPREFKPCKWSDWITEKAKRIIIPQCNCKRLNCLEWFLLGQNITVCCKKRTSFCFLFSFEYFHFLDLIFVKWIVTDFIKKSKVSSCIVIYTREMDQWLLQFSDLFAFFRWLGLWRNSRLALDY